MITLYNSKGDSTAVWFAMFVQEVCNPNGDSYPPRTLHSIVFAVRILNSTSLHFVSLILFLALFELLIRMDILCKLSSSLAFFI